jgi:hypothetical protein
VNVVAAPGARLQRLPSHIPAQAIIDRFYAFVLSRVIRRVMS